MSTSVVARSKKRKRTAQLQTRLDGGYWRRNAAQMDDGLTTSSKAATSKRTRKVKVIVTSEVPHCAHPFAIRFIILLIIGFMGSFDLVHRTKMKVKRLTKLKSKTGYQVRRRSKIQRPALENQRHEHHP